MRSLVIVVLAAAVGCSDTSSVDSCPVERTVCGTSCIDTQTDPDHCGACGATCDADRTCVQGRCASACEIALDAVVVDDWNTAWDGTPREPLPYAEAAESCTSLGARLPTASELHRVRVPGALEHLPLWSSTADDVETQVTVGLLDGVASTAPLTKSVAYRCVCPAPVPDGFAGSRCHGPAFSPCFALGPLNVDNHDRPALRRNAAIAECANEHAHLADLPVLAEALLFGLVGSGSTIQTADVATYERVSTIRWTVARWLGYPGELGHLEVSAELPFRCAGWRVPNAGYRADPVDHPIATWTVAHDDCIARGGHLARAAELTELIRAGLGNGSGFHVWTSDQTGYGNLEFLAASVKWTGSEPRHASVSLDTLSWRYKHDTLPYRCLYYPVDPEVTAPTECEGGCSALTLGGSSGAILWFDAVDRPAMRFDQAIDQCRQRGGHLPSERDLTEAIRGGLANGTFEYLWTTEVGAGLDLTYYGQPIPSIVRFKNTNPMFDDLYNAGVADATWSTTDRTFGYRCMWTNEQR
ncbi:MAG: Tryptophan synthase alpha chain [Myxococcales bacterium]|nr:Tryptophan synthase alpha chain [Myxococcales bacterium]